MSWIPYDILFRRRELGNYAHQCWIGAGHNEVIGVKENSCALVVMIKKKALLNNNIYINQQSSSG